MKDIMDITRTACMLTRAGEEGGAEDRDYTGDK